jgi:hypothetical protein
MEKNTAQTENLENEPIIPDMPAVASETNKPFIPHHTLILIGVLSLITIILLALAFNIGLPNANKPTAQKPVKVLKTTLSILKPVVSASIYTSDITLTTERKSVTAVQIELTYDPKVLTNVDIKPGSFFSNPTSLSKKIDTIKGRVTYILGIGLGQNPVNGNGTVAILSFTPLLKSGITTIAFLPTSKLTVSGTVPSVLTTGQGLQFSFGK